MFNIKKTHNMKTNNLGLISEAFGHGFMSLNMAKSYSLTPVAFSEKETKEEFESDVDKIYNNLSFFYPEMQKATWEQRDELANCWNIRKSLLQGEMSQENWDKMATVKLTPKINENLPRFAEIEKYGYKTMFVPQKLISDGKCGVTAKEQSVSPQVFDCIKETEDKAILGQHFHKVNDLEVVKSLALEFNAYVAGLTENPELLGIRGISHKMYWNLFKQLDCCIGIAGTHTWYNLTCFPEKSQIILYHNKMTENWEQIAKAYRKVNSPITSIDYDDNTSILDLAKEVKFAYNLIRR